MTSLRDRGILIIDCQVSCSPGEGGLNVQHIPQEAFHDDESLDAWPSLGIVEYLFKGAAGERVAAASDPAQVVQLLDQWGIQRAQVVLGHDVADKIDALQKYGDRWFFSLRVNPHLGMREVRRLEAMVRDYPSIRACYISPHALVPTIPANSKEY